jgi:hypothetical protein
MRMGSRSIRTGANRGAESGQDARQRYILLRLQELAAGIVLVGTFDKRT